MGDIDDGFVVLLLGILPFTNLGNPIGYREIHTQHAQKFNQPEFWETILLGRFSLIAIWMGRLNWN